MLHVDTSGPILSGKRAASHGVLDDENDAKFTANAIQLTVQQCKLGSALEVFILGSVDLIAVIKNDRNAKIETNASHLSFKFVKIGRCCKLRQLDSPLHFKYSKHIKSLAPVDDVRLDPQSFTFSQHFVHLSR